MKKYCAFLFALTLPLFAWGQLAATSEAEVAFGRWYDALVGLENTPLVKGLLYPMSPRAKTTHPFFNSKFWSSGEVILSGQHYANVPLVFDVEQELLVMKHPQAQRLEGISLNMDAVDAFKLHGHIFKRLTTAEAAGFYDLLYEGDSVSLIVKRAKEYAVKKEGVEFVPRDEFYVLASNQLLPITNLRSLKKHFPGHWSLLKKIRKERKLKFTSRHERQMTELIERFDKSLTAS